MLSFDVEEYEEAFCRSGSIRLTIGGKIQTAHFSTRRYEEARSVYHAEQPRPKQKPSGHKMIHVDSDLGKQLGLSTTSLIEVYDPDDYSYRVKDAAHTAECGRYFAAYCLDVELTSGGQPLDEKAKLEVYRRVMPDITAAELSNAMTRAIQLEIGDAADFFDGSSESTGDSGKNSQEVSQE